MKTASWWKSISPVAALPASDPLFRQCGPQSTHIFLCRLGKHFLSIPPFFLVSPAEACYDPLVSILRSQFATSTFSSQIPVNKSAIILTRRVGSRILILRNQKVILDSDLAELYGVSVKRLNEQMKRNPRRFPPDFFFTLTRAEYQNLGNYIYGSHV